MLHTYLYRIFRLRRLIITCGVTVILGLFMGEWFLGPSTLLADPTVKTAAVATCIAILLALIMIYPRVWWETVSAALVFGLLLMLMPLIEIMPYHMPRDEGLMAVLWTLFIVVFGSIFLWLGLNRFSAILCAIPSPSMRDEARISVALPAETLFDTLKLRPDSDDGINKTGPVDAEGFFDLSFELNSTDPETYLPITETMSVRARIIEEGPLSQDTAFGFDIDGEILCHVQRLVVEEKNGRSICRTTTQKSGSSVLESLGFWMLDYGSDYLLSHLMYAQELPSYCLRDLPYRSPLYDLARYFDNKNNGPGRQTPGF